MSTDKAVVRRVRSHSKLIELFEAIESGRAAKPDWIYLERDCRLDTLQPAQLEATLGHLFRCVLRGFRAPSTRPRTREARLALWCQIASHGFHDFGSRGWAKRFDSPFAESYDYVTPYLEGGLDALDPYLIYSAVLGTHDFSAEEFLTTDLCSGVEALIEPMAGTAEFTREGHFRYPDLRYVMIDLDEAARDHVMARPWLEGTEHHYLIADVLAADTWQEARKLARGTSLAYIGKQSHHLFDAQQVLTLLEVATRHVDYLMLETPQITLVNQLAEVDELTRPEMDDAGFRVALQNEPGGMPNPFTNEMAFRLDAWDRNARRTLFHYHGWTAWYPPTLVAFARIVGLDAYYFSESDEQFVPVQQHPAEESDDCHENPTFMVFTRRSARAQARGRAPRRERAKPAAVRSAAP